MCVCERQKERECVCVCEREREREAANTDVWRAQLLQEGAQAQEKDSMEMMQVSFQPLFAIDRLHTVWDSRLTRRGTTHSRDLSGRGAARAEDAQGTPTQSHISPTILVYKDNWRLGPFETRKVHIINPDLSQKSHVASFPVENSVTRGSGTEESLPSLVRLIDFCITQLQARE